MGTLLIIFKLIITFICSSIFRLTSGSHPVINKCCGLNETFNVTSGACEFSGDNNSTGWSIPKGFNFDDENEDLLIRWDQAKQPLCSKQLKTIVTLFEGGSSTEQYFFTESGNLIEIIYNSPFDEMGIETAHLPAHFCVDALPSALILRICPPLCNDEEPCLRKCCPRGEHYSFDDGGCRTTPKTFRTQHQLPLYKLGDQPTSKNKPVDINATRISVGHSFIQNCSQKIMITTGWSFAGFSKPFKVLTNSSLVLFDPNVSKWKALDTPLDYCVDRIHSTKRPRLCEEDEEVLYICLIPYDYIDNNTDDAINMTSKPTTQAFSKWRNKLAGVTLIIAIVCLLLTAVVVFLLIDRVNLHSWTRLSFIVSEFIFLFLFSLVFSERFKHGKYPKSCTAFAVIFHFSGLMTMCWLSIINFDLWWTFKVLKPTSSQRFDVRRYLYYVIFAVGVPSIIVGTALGIQASKPRYDPSGINKPGLVCRKDVEDQIRISLELMNSKIVYPDYGERSCALASESLGAYWYGPLCFLLLANAIFFFATTFRMVRLRRMTRRASIESTSGQQSQSNQLFMKIFIVSGITWNIELIGWLFNLEKKYRLRLDIVHHLQAMALFVIFVCKKEVIRNLQRKYPIITKVIPPVGNLRRSATIASMSTDASSRVRVGRKMSSASDNSIVAQSFQRQESFDLQVSPSAPPPERL